MLFATLVRTRSKARYPFNLSSNDNAYKIAAETTLCTINNSNTETSSELALAKPTKANISILDILKVVINNIDVDKEKYKNYIKYRH